MSEELNSNATSMAQYLSEKNVWIKKKKKQQNKNDRFNSDIFDGDAVDREFVSVWNAIYRTQSTFFPILEIWFSNKLALVAFHIEWIRSFVFIQN